MVGGLPAFGLLSDSPVRSRLHDGAGEAATFLQQCESSLGEGRGRRRSPNPPPGCYACSRDKDVKQSDLQPAADWWSAQPSNLLLSDQRLWLNYESCHSITVVKRLIIKLLYQVPMISGVVKNIMHKTLEI